MLSYAYLDVDYQNLCCIVYRPVPIGQSFCTVQPEIILGIKFGGLASTDVNKNFCGF